MCQDSQINFSVGGRGLCFLLVEIRNNWRVK